MALKEHDSFVLWNGKGTQLGSRPDSVINSFVLWNGKGAHLGSTLILSLTFNEILGSPFPILGAHFLICKIKILEDTIFFLVEGRGRSPAP